MESYGRYAVAREWYHAHSRLRGIARSQTLLTGTVVLERQWRARAEQEERQLWVRLGCNHLWEVVRTERLAMERGAESEFMMLHSLSKGKRIICRHASGHTRMLAETLRKCERVPGEPQ